MATATKTPAPRSASFYGMSETAHINSNGTWLEPEAFCYGAKRGNPKVRRAYVRFPDGSLRIVRCGIPDTYFSIDAVARIKGATVRGYVTGGEAGYEFRVYDADKAKLADLTQ